MNDKILAAIYSAIDELNEMREPGNRIAKAPNTILSAADGALDSLALVNLIVAVETNIEKSLGRILTLTDDLDSNAGTRAFHDVASLQSHVAALLNVNTGE